MIRVGLITTSWTAHRCGVAEYSRMLIDNNTDPEIQFTPIFGPYEFANLYPRVMAGNFDVIHFNYDSGFLGIFALGIATRFRAAGAKIVITLCDHHPRNNHQLFPFIGEFDRVIVHQPTGDGGNVMMIPVGIDVMENSPWSPENKAIGTCGFPLPQKAVHLVAHAAALLQMPCTMVCSESQHADTHQIGREIKAIWPHTNYITNWMPQREVQNIMAGNLVNVFPMRDGKSGISASVRMGVATGSHMVLSRSWMFSDWRDDDRYSGEIEWVPGEANDVTPQAIADAVRRVLQNGKRPKRILEDFSWKKSAKSYTDVYRELVGQEVAA